MAAEPTEELGEVTAKSKVAGIPAFPYPDDNDLSSLEAWCKTYTEKSLGGTTFF